MDWGPLAAAAATVLVAFVGGFFTFFGARSKTRIDLQQAINSSLTTLLAEHRKDAEQFREIIKEQRKTIEAQADEIEALEGEKRRGIAHELALEAQIRRAGLKPVPPSDVSEI